MIKVGEKIRKYLTLSVHTPELVLFFLSGNTICNSLTFPILLSALSSFLLVSDINKTSKIIPLILDYLQFPLSCQCFLKFTYYKINSKNGIVHRLTLVCRRCPWLPINCALEH